MRTVPWWALVSAAFAPAALVAGWMLAAALQPPGYDPVTATISALAAYGAADRWVMTLALLVLGLCHSVTALGLRAAAVPARVVLACGGAASLMVAFSPEPPGGGTSVRHFIATGVGFTALVLWPCLAAVRDRAAPWPLRSTTARATALVLVGVAVWFLVALHDHGDAGVAERVLTGAQSLWPLVVVTALRLTRYQPVRARQQPLEVGLTQPGVTEP